MKIVVIMIGILMVLTINVFAAEKTINTYDMTYLYKLDVGKPDEAKRAWDESHFIATIQGIVNQKSPELFVFFVGSDGESDRTAGTDHFWFDKMTAKGDWMGDWTVNKISDLDALIAKYRDVFKGLVVYDGNVPATSNVASTIAGVDMLAAVRYDTNKDSLYYYLTTDEKGPKLPVFKWLVNKDGSSKFTGKGIIPDIGLKSTGSSKCDAYIWAKTKYLDTGKCNPHVLGYYIDSFWLNNPGGRLTNHTLTNHDYVISKKGFLFDLSPWDDEPATDEPGQPIGTDANTLKAILLSAYKESRGKMIQAAGFLPWNRKYTQHANGKHEDVAGEWKYSEILSCYNAYMDADALDFSGMANGSIFTQFKLKDKYPQKKPTIDDLKATGYILPDGTVKNTSFVTFYVGDYDAAAWVYQRMPVIWEEKTRGEFPLGWAINPNLSERFAYGMDYIRKTATANDYFVTGDVGAGYINPGHLVTPRQYSGLPSGVKAWRDHCKHWMDIFDLSIVGFVIDGYAPPMNDELMDMYAEIAPDGIGGQKLPAHDGVYKGKMPYIKMEADVYKSVEDAKLQAKNMGETIPEFKMFRNILWKPSSQKEFMDTMKTELNGNVEFLSPYHFFLLLKYFHDSGQKAALPKDNKNLFDYRAGIDITSYSPLNSVSDIRDMFKGDFSSVESKVVLFADGMMDPAMHWVEWNTAAPVDLASVLLQVRGDGPKRIRNVSGFRLGIKNNIDEPWNVVISKEFNYPYIEDNVFNLEKTFKAKYFRAEFFQDPYSEELGRGPRILEIQGFSEKQ